MWHKLTTSSAALLFIIAGCKTLHTDDGSQHQAPVAMWSDFVVVDKDGQKQPASPELIVASLKKAGIAATVDDRGLHIAPADEQRATMALLTDPRLKGSGILLLVPVEAGTGRRTPNAIEFSMPMSQLSASTNQPSMPTSQPSK